MNNKNNSVLYIKLPLSQCFLLLLSERKDGFVCLCRNSTEMESTKLRLKKNNKRNLELGPPTHGRASV